jgi:transposase
MKKRVELSAEQRESLKKKVSSGKGPARELVHAHILLKVDVSTAPRLTDEAAARETGVSARTVERVRRRFCEGGLGAALSRRPQPARPDKRKLTDEVEARLVALACSAPPEGRARWSLHLLAERSVGLVEGGLSHESVRQALKKTS